MIKHTLYAITSQQWEITKFSKLKDLKIIQYVNGQIFRQSKHVFCYRFEGLTNVEAEREIINSLETKLRKVFAGLTSLVDERF
jgi:uncharacterized protein YjhX (UPF0386 family)